MKTVKMKLPSIETRPVWIGSYGGHYTAIVIFHTKPNKVKKGWDSFKQSEYNIVDLLDNKHNIAACMWECDFRDLYPDAKIPPAKEIGNNLI